MIDSKAINLSRVFNVPSATVFEAIRAGGLFQATGIKIESFHHDFREGGAYSLEWQVGGKCAGRYLEIAPDKKVKFTWSSEACESSTRGETTVTVTLKEQGKDCELRLVHE